MRFAGILVRPLLFVMVVALPLGGTEVPAKPSEHPLTAAEVAAAPATIDALVLADLTAHGVTPNPDCDEPTFLRRAYLALIGRIPTLEEIAAYTGAAPGPSRRRALIAQLQAGPGRVHHDFTWWADLLRLATNLGDRYPGQAYLDWVKEQVRANRHYDVLVRDLITAQGPALARGNGATGYYLRDAGMPLDSMANTIQVFLGTRVQCAMCHNHPTDRWTRQEFYAQAAYTEGVAIRRDLPGVAKLRQMAKVQNLSPGVRDELAFIGNSLGLRVEPGMQATIALPVDYQYPDAKPGTVIPAHALFGAPASVPPGVSPVQVYAAWLTSPANPRFTRTIVNRLWKRAFGLGLDEPVDNLTDSATPTNPDLMRFLTKLMVSVDYDLTRFSGMLYATRAWQRQASASEPVGGEPYRFPGPLLHRMSAEQIWDSLLTLAVPDLDRRQGANAEGLYRFYTANHGRSATELFNLAAQRGALRDAQRRIERELDARWREMAPLTNRDSGRGKRLSEEIAALSAEHARLAEQLDPGRMAGGDPAAGRAAQFLRAAELPSPAPPGHLLRIFGQSDRELIDSARSEPATTQALAMLNGFIDQELLAEDALFYRTVLRPKEVGERVEILFEAVLTRPPTSRERDLGRAELAATLLDYRKEGKGGPDADLAKEAAKEALRNLAWVLLNGHEFLFVQ
jgi:Protein of unknown function (DUF1549)/Protein of unknown function (DUF1553)